MGKKAFKMLRGKERERRERSDLMTSFIILRLISQSIKEKELEKEATNYFRLGRLKLIDLAIYEMAKKRRDMGVCPQDQNENMVTVSKAPSDPVLQSSSQPATSSANPPTQPPPI